MKDWDESRLLPFRSQKPPLTVEDIGRWLEQIIEGLHYQQFKGEVGMQMQVQSIRSSKSADKDLPFDVDAHQCLADGDLIIVDAYAVSFPTKQQRPEPSEEDLSKFRESLRYGLNDRVLCFCGPRWLSGLIAGSAVPDEGDILPYLVKTDPLAGLPSNTISVPADNDDTCTLEVCFDSVNELHLTKASAQHIKSKVKLRFAVGQKVVCRIRNSSQDSLEQWVPGTVSVLWPELPGERKWEMGGVSGEFPAAVPYKVDLSNGAYAFCQRDHHTLIRREGMEPQTKVKGTSKRMEVRVTKDGTQERVDHETERSKRMMKVESDSD